MADVTIVSQLMVSKGALQDVSTYNYSADLTDNSYVSETVDLTTEVTTLLLPPTNGEAKFVNLSATHSIQIGILDAAEYGGNFVPFLELPPLRGIAGVPLADGQVAARAVTLTAKLEYRIYAR